MVFSTRCLFGSIESAECCSLTSPTRAKILANPLCKPIGGCRCRLCSLYTCYRCTTRIHNNIENDDAAGDSWCQEVDKCLQLPKQEDSDFILPRGPCCEHKQQVLACTDKISSTAFTGLPTDHINRTSRISSDVETTVVRLNVGMANQKSRKRQAKRRCRSIKRKRLKTNKELGFQYSGCLHWAGCDLIVDSPMNGVIDIHGAGALTAHGPPDNYGRQKEVGKVKGIPHCVIGRPTAHRLEQNNVAAKPFHTIHSKAGVKHLIDTMEIINPFSPLSAKIQVSSSSQRYPFLLINYNH